MTDISAYILSTFLLYILYSSIYLLHTCTHTRTLLLLFEKRREKAKAYRCWHTYAIPRAHGRRARAAMDGDGGGHILGRRRSIPFAVLFAVSQRRTNRWNVTLTQACLWWREDRGRLPTGAVVNTTPKLLLMVAATRRRPPLPRRQIGGEPLYILVNAYCLPLLHPRDEPLRPGVPTITLRSLTWQWQLHAAALLPSLSSSSSI